MYALIDRSYTEIVILKMSGRIYYYLKSFKSSQNNRIRRFFIQFIQQTVYIFNSKTAFQELFLESIFYDGIFCCMSKLSEPAAPPAYRLVIAVRSRLCPFSRIKVSTF